MEESRNLNEGERRAAEALGLIMRITNVSDVELARRLVISHQRVHARRTGLTRLRVGEIAQYAAALDVPTFLFDFEAAELLRWFADHYDAVVTHRYSEQLDLWATAA